MAKLGKPSPARRVPNSAGSRVPLLRFGLSDVAPRVTLGDVVAGRLREAILSGEVVPGQHLREEEISEGMQVSRGPVRDAFVMLHREGLVQISRHRGVSVVELTAIDLGEVYSLRTAIEELAVRFAVRRHTADDLSALQAVLQRLDDGLRGNISEHEAARLDVGFHDAIFAAAHHTRLQASWVNIRMQVYWFLLKRNIANADWRQNFVVVHQDLLRLLEASEEEKMVAATRAHTLGAYRRILAAYGDEDEMDSVFLLG